jgi:hypothetical protein
MPDGNTHANIVAGLGGVVISQVNPGLDPLLTDPDLDQQLSDQGEPILVDP